MCTPSNAVGRLLGSRILCLQASEHETRLKARKRWKGTRQRASGGGVVGLRLASDGRARVSVC